jgi:hypothetical protein
MAREVKMKKPVKKIGTLEMYCLSVLIGECAGVVYVIGTTVLKVFNLW